MFEFAAIEFLWIEFRIKHRDVLCGVCYRPPDNDSVSLANFFEYFQLVLDKIRQIRRRCCIGRFQCSLRLYKSIRNSDVGEKLYSFLENNNLVQLITEPTRVTCHSLTILASVITNCPGHSSTSETLSPPSNCDHSVIFANMNIFAYRSRSYKRQVWNFNNVDTTNVNGELLELDWISLCENIKDIDEIYSRWYGYFRLIVEKYIPLKTVTIRAKDKPWTDSKVHLSIKRRDHLLRFHKKTPISNNVGTLSGST